jgi:arginyl-tRNA--protein-N-Asp/Glu arginylyltransferase
MTHLHDLPAQTLRYYASASYACSYLPDKTARSLVATPSHLINAGTYSLMIRNGFRRSGLYTYRPFCDQCEACVPVRVPVATFKPTRSQKRAFQHFTHLDVSIETPTYHESHYALYLRYQNARHAGGGMDQDEPDQYRLFLLQSNVNSKLLVFREPALNGAPGVVKMVSLIDLVDDGFSAVYTFFEPSETAGLGTYNVMWLLAEARRQNLQHVYLGYWIAKSQKMAYKARFQPQEHLQNGTWSAPIPHDKI